MTNQAGVHVARVPKSGSTRGRRKGGGAGGRLSGSTRATTSHGRSWPKDESRLDSALLPLSKNGQVWRVPVNAAVRSALMDVATARQRPADPTEPVFSVSDRHAVRLFGKAVERAQEALRDAGKDTSRLDRFTWHG
jgi:hypothetical protein